jgi:hypothetical protein
MSITLARCLREVRFPAILDSSVGREPVAFRKPVFAALRTLGRRTVKLRDTQTPRVQRQWLRL